MTADQRDLLLKAQASLNAAHLLHGEGFHAFSASRSYYAMFNVYCGTPAAMSPGPVYAGGCCLLHGGRASAPAMP